MILLRYKKLLVEPAVFCYGMSMYHTTYHNDGSIWAKGEMIEGVCEGYWEWYRKDGSKMRSGYFEDGKQIGEWITYDSKGKIVKITMMKKTAQV